MEDSRGVIRGACNACGCAQYSPLSGGADVEGRTWKCSACGHPPAKHRKLGAKKTCRYPGCYAALDFDPNTGTEKPWCQQHEGYEGPTEVFSSAARGVMQVQDVEYEDFGYGASYAPDATAAVPTLSWGHPPARYQTAGVFMSDGSGTFALPMQPAAHTQFHPGFQGIDQLQAGVTSMSVAQCSVPGQQKCAIPECPRPCYIENGKVHKCCGRTHARELEQRQSQKQGMASVSTATAGQAPVPGQWGTGPQAVHLPVQGLQVPPPLPGQATGLQVPPPLPGHATGLQVPPPLPGQATGSQAPQPGPQTVPTLPSGQRKCAIQECQNPCFVDEAGTVHECCGIMHAMEHQRRKTIQQQKQVVKGVTHCLLPECNRIVWPFKNYCGKTHADIGRQRGLEPPAPPPADPSVPKDSSLCIIPGCSSKKFSDASGLTHPYCGRTHAELGKKKNILPTAEKQEDQCGLPGCKAPKRKDGGRVHEYCSQSHAQQDAPNRDARILTDMTSVKTFLGGFSKLKGYTITDNQHAKPGGVLFNKFKQKWSSLPKTQRTTCLAFHGTAEKNISSICQNGYNEKLRSGQAYGTGEYFATTPDIPFSYCKGGKKMLLNELLLGQLGNHHTKHGTIIVMKDAAHDLPRFVVTFP